MSREVHRVRENTENRRFEIELGDGTFAFADYNLVTGKIMFTHTEVPGAHEGKGIGTALIRAGLDAACDRGLKVIPICPFFAAYMQKHAEVHDLLDGGTAQLPSRRIEGAQMTVIGRNMPRMRHSSSSSFPRRLRRTRQGKRVHRSK